MNTVSSTNKKKNIIPSKKPNTEKPYILVCNDDGIDAEGIEALAFAMKKLGDVVVVAPASPQSGMSHAMTLGKPHRITHWNKHKKISGYSVAGTPVDCVKVALTKIVRRKPDLMVSGINYGSNTAINILYSGTVGAAIEASIFGVPSIAFSLTTYQTADFTYASKFAHTLAKKVLREGLPSETILTVNIPNLPEKDIKGVVVTRQGKSKWEEELLERQDAYGLPYYWLKGTMNLYDDSIEDDEFAIRKGYVSVTPINYDLTHDKFMETVKAWKLKK